MRDLAINPFTLVSWFNETWAFWQRLPIKLKNFCCTEQRRARLLVDQKNLDPFTTAE